MHTVKGHISYNGLENDEFIKTRESLLRVAERIAKFAQSDSGHLGDIVSGLRTNASILEIHAEKLWSIFEQQKNNHTNSKK